MLVDDEYNVRDGLKYLIDWNCCGFEIAYEAQNGKAAWETIEKEKPDLVITDVKMPVMDGLELLSCIKKEYPIIRIIVLSGYNDFDYVKCAMRYGAVDYLLKPVDEDELIELLKRIKNEIDLEIKSKQREKAMAQVFKEKAIQDIVKHQLNETSIKKLIEDYDLELDDGYYSILIFEPDVYLKRNSCVDNKIYDNNFNYNKSLIRNIAEDILNREFKGYVFNEDGMGLGVLIMANEEVLLENYIERFISKFKLLIYEILKTTFSFGIGHIVNKIKDIHYSYSSSKNALELKFFRGNNSIININGTANNIMPYNQKYDNINYKSLLACIKIFDEDALKIEVDHLFQTLTEQMLSKDEIKGLILEIMIDISKMIYQKDADFIHIYADAGELFGEISEMRTLEEIKVFFTQYCIKACRILKNSCETTPREVISKTLEYINQHYGEDISLKKIANNVFFCQSYLGKLFKQATGESFNNYLTRIRIENAQKMLSNSEMKIYEIAQKVGYRSIDYFRKQFKAITGLGPVEFKTFKKRSKNNII